MPLLDQAQNWRATESVAAAIANGPESLPDSTMAVRAVRQMQTALKPPAPLRIQSRPLKVAHDATWQRMTLEFSDTTWEVDLAFDYGDASAEWIEVGAPLSQPGGSRQLQVKLSMHHPFSKRFMRPGDEGVEGIARIAAGLAIAEAIAQKDGARFSGRIRTSLNELLGLGLAD